MAAISIFVYNRMLNFFTIKLTITEIVLIEMSAILKFWNTVIFSYERDRVYPSIIKITQSVLELYKVFLKKK